jgi:hypothetical protein
MPKRKPNVKQAARFAEGLNCSRPEGIRLIEGNRVGKAWLGQETG